jgi:hypothetical protein
LGEAPGQENQMEKEDDSLPKVETQIPPPDLFADPCFLRQFLDDAEAYLEFERQRQAELFGPKPSEITEEVKS